MDKSCDNCKLQDICFIKRTITTEIGNPVIMERDASGLVGKTLKITIFCELWTEVKKSIE